ncbi:hypothetical protein BC830DRAFT_1232301 [Chytriomyces sp. MP71]|nr:hypothetical protein BC830DRAFT_1232301 [Chytriomyces sp. MP71]
MAQLLKLTFLLLTVAAQNANINQIRGGGMGIAAAQQAAAMPKSMTADMGLNLLLHGDGDQSHFAMPNARLGNNLIGVTVLAPNAQMKWVGVGNNCPDAPQHAFFVYFTGVSGGSLTLTTAMIPMFGNMFQSGYLILCGGHANPKIIPAGAIGPNTRIHFQTTTNELTFLQQSIPQIFADINQAVAELDLPANQAAKNSRSTALPRADTAPSTCTPSRAGSSPCVLVVVLVRVILREVCETLAHLQALGMYLGGVKAAKVLFNDVYPSSVGKNAAETAFNVSATYATRK